MATSIRIGRRLTVEIACVGQSQRESPSAFFSGEELGMGYLPRLSCSPQIGFQVFKSGNVAKIHGSMTVC